MVNLIVFLSLMASTYAQGKYTHGDAENNHCRHVTLFRLSLNNFALYKIVVIAFNLIGR